ncbi:helix-turn-helix transcriptional regulator [Sphingobacterium sp.]|uniref:helix-turn-helix domain-containing protein n=1 Tax=Sphingobacterium sp. TaxID=341027 RepID=UPI00289CAC62|nr:helix-turn-helix transcriptional regulator [Sphingobacterium sp.]
MESQSVHHITSISQLVRELGLEAPSHPLVTVVDYSTVSTGVLVKGQKISLDLYKISFKPDFIGKSRYGQGYYDYEEGGLAFLKPRQIVFFPEDPNNFQGFSLYFHPDFIRNYPLGKTINYFGFFSYAVSEALFLSAKEIAIVANLFTSITHELDTNIDAFSQDVLVSQIELLLNYSNRFYNRQFITRKAINNDIVDALNKLLEVYYERGDCLKMGIPTVQYVSKELNLSQRYLSDLLQSVTGLNTQQYIQNVMIERAKDKLCTTDLSVSEIAYELGFEYPQSFSKLFKNKTSISPLVFRKSFH